MIYDSSQAIDGRSRWLVGSSRSNMSGLLKSSLPSDTRVFSPPERRDIFLSKSSSENPRPLRTPTTSLLAAYPLACSNSWSRSVYVSSRALSSSPDACFICFSRERSVSSRLIISSLTVITSSYMVLSEEIS